MNKDLPNYIKAVYIFLLIAFIILTLILGKSLLIPLFISSYLAMLLTPFCNWLEKWKFPRIFSSLVALIASIIFVGGILFFLISQVSKFSEDFDDIGKQVDTYLVQADSLLKENLGFESGLKNGIDQEMIMNFLENNSGDASNFLLAILGSLTPVILVPIFLFFILLYRGKIARFVLKLYASNSTGDIEKKMESLRSVIQKYISGLGKVMAILAVLNSTVLMIIGVEHAILFGCIAALLDIIPYVGPLLAAILPITYALLTMDGLFYPLAILIAFILIQNLEGYVLTPKIVGGNVNINPFAAVLGLIIGGMIWGPIGMILIIPTLAILSKLFYYNESTKPYSYLISDEE